MCVVKIYAWYGRFGNNITQLAKCLYFAFIIHNAERIIFPKHSLFNTTTISNASMECCKCCNIMNNEKRDIHNFYYHPDINISKQRIITTICL